MKRRNKITKVICALFGASLLLGGCGKKIAEPDVTAKAYYDLVILAQTEEVEKIGMPKDVADELIKSEKELSVKSYMDQFASSGVDIEESKTQEVVEAVLNAMHRVSATTEVVSKDEEKARVKVSTTYIDCLNILENVTNSTVKEFENRTFDSDITEEQTMKMFMDSCIEKLIKGLNDAQPSSDVVEKEFDFALEDEGISLFKVTAWNPSDPEDFGTQLGSMVLGMK